MNRVSPSPSTAPKLRPTVKVKTLIRHGLSESGLLVAINLVRSTPRMIRLMRGGADGVAPQPLKAMILRSYLQRFGLRHFLETSTHRGDTLAVIARDRSVSCVSIELSKKYYRAAAHRFRKYPNVSLRHGDSSVVLPECLRELQDPYLFWLDGHYSAGDTARGPLDTPVVAEVAAIIASPVAGHVVLIDDVRCFHGSDGYPHLDELLARVRQDGRYLAEVSADILRLTPRAGSNKVAS